jgi:two-component system, cell cycle response regulator
VAQTTVDVARVEDLLRHDARAALRSAREMLAQLGPDADSLRYQRLLLAKGSAQARIGETEDGARIMREVKDWAEKREEHALLACTHRRLSSLFRRVGDPVLMLEHAVTAVNLAGDDVDEHVRADYLLGLADALGAGGSYEESIARYQEAFTLADRCGDRFLRLTVLNNLAFTQYEAGLGPAAVATAERLRADASADGQPLSKHDGDTIARTYTAVGRYEEAASVLEPLCSEQEGGEDCDGLVLALLALAEVRRLAGEHDAAQDALDRVGRLIDRYALSGRRIEAMREQAEVHAARGAFEAAYETFRDFHLADVQLRAVERGARARTLNAIFEATEARRSSDYFRELSVRDPLTGLHNRRHLDNQLAELLGGAGVGVERPVLTVGLVDLDHFKRVNDTRSHAVGDEVLRRVAAIMQRSADAVAGGLVGRMGGEEFLVLLPAVQRSDGVARLASLCADIADQPWHELTEGVDVTASIGVAASPDDDVEPSALLATADRNLYRAKRAGRNRVVN